MLYRMVKCEWNCWTRCATQVVLTVTSVLTRPCSLFMCPQPLPYAPLAAWSAPTATVTQHTSLHMQCKPTRQQLDTNQATACMPANLPLQTNLQISTPLSTRCRRLQPHTHRCKQPRTPDTCSNTFRLARTNKASRESFRTMFKRLLLPVHGLLS